jgi:hypothetical protein
MMLFSSLNGILDDAPEPISLIENEMLSSINRQSMQKSIFPNYLDNTGDSMHFYY